MISGKQSRSKINPPNLHLNLNFFQKSAEPGRQMEESASHSFGGVWGCEGFLIDKHRHTNEKRWLAWPCARSELLVADQ